MAKNIQQTEQTSVVETPTITPEEQLRKDTMALADTSKKIRFLLSQGKTVGETYKLINSYGVTTKEGKEIRYQHVRNVAMTKLSTK